MIHGELSEIDAILTTPNLEVMKILNGGLLWRKHQDYIFLIIFSNHHCHMGICPEIEIRTSLLCCSDGLDYRIPQPEVLYFLPILIGIFDDLLKYQML